MSLFTSWSVQVVGKQTQSLPGYVRLSPTLTSIHLVSMQMFMAAPQSADMDIFLGVNFKIEVKIDSNISLGLSSSS